LGAPKKKPSAGPNPKHVQRHEKEVQRIRKEGGGIAVWAAGPAPARRGIEGQGLANQKRGYVEAGPAMKSRKIHTRLSAATGETHGRITGTRSLQKKVWERAEHAAKKTYNPNQQHRSCFACPKLGTRPEQTRKTNGI